MNKARVVHDATCQAGRCRGMWVADQSELPSGDMGTSGPIKFFDMLLLLKSENQDEMCAQATGRHTLRNQWQCNNIKLDFKTAVVQISGPHLCMGVFCFGFGFSNGGFFNVYFTLNPPDPQLHMTG